MMRRVLFMPIAVTLQTLLAAPIRVETVHPADPCVASYEVSFHVTRVSSRRVALSVLKAAGFEYVRGTATNSKYGYMPGFWRRGQRRAYVEGATISLDAKSASK